MRISEEQMANIYANRMHRSAINEIKRLITDFPKVEYWKKVLMYLETKWN